MEPPFDEAAAFADVVERLLGGTKDVATWRAVVRAFVYAPTTGGRDQGHGAVIGWARKDGNGDAFFSGGFDADDVARRLAAPGKKTREWEPAYEWAVYRHASEGQTRLAASDAIVALLGDTSRAAKLSALERRALAFAQKAVRDPVTVSTALAVERRIELAGGGPRVDHFGAAIELKFVIRCDATPHRLYGEELTAADLYDWKLASRHLAGFPSDEELERVVNEAIASAR